MSPIARFATFKARPGEGQALAALLLHAASLVADASGCELWLVSRDHADADTIRVAERWASREQCDAALRLEGVPENAARVMERLAGPPEVVDAEPLGGARELRGTTGATAFSILDAPTCPRTPTSSASTAWRASERHATCTRSSVACRPG